MARRYGILILALLPLIGTIAPAEYLGLQELLNGNDLYFQWDMFRRIGAVWSDNQVVSFRPGDGWALHNFATRIPLGDVEYDGRRLLFSEEALRQIRDLLAPPRALSGRTVGAIFIDAGHGGKDPGAIGTHTVDGNRLELNEKDIVLSVALELRQLLANRYSSKQIILSRDSDVYLSLEERTQIANSVSVEANEDIIFISLHANASLNGKAKGFEIWYLPPQYRRSDLVSAKETGVDDPSVLAILNTIKEEEYTIESVLLARTIIEEMDSHVGHLSINRGIKQASWHVVRQAKMPSVLIELGFVSNPDEAHHLMDDGYLQRLVSGIYDGIESFIDDFEG